MAKEIHRYCVRTNNELVLKNIQLNNSCLSMVELEDYAGEEGLWKVDTNYLRFTVYCSRCGWRTHNRHAKYCEACGSHNRLEREVKE